MKFFNPKLQEFLQNKPQMSLVGFAWAVYWRIAVIFLLAELIIFALFFIFVFLGIITAAFFGTSS